MYIFALPASIEDYYAACIFHTKHTLYLCFILMIKAELLNRDVCLSSKARNRTNLTFKKKLTLGKLNNYIIFPNKFDAGQLRYSYQTDYKNFKSQLWFLITKSN